MYRKTKRSFVLTIGTILAVTALVGCSSGSETGAQTAAAINPADFEPDGIVGLGPNGETAVPTGDVTLTEEQLAKVRAGNFQVALAMQTGDIDFVRVQVAALTKTFEDAGVEVVAVTDAQFKAEKQISDVENLIQLQPDGILGVPVDDVATAAAFGEVAAAGIKLVMIDQVPRGLSYPQDYQSLVQADGRGNGQAAMAMLATRVPDGGTVGMVNFANDIFATNERTAGAKEWLKANRPDIQLKETSFTDPGKVGQIATDFLTANPDVQGVWVVWDAPALQVIEAMRGTGTNIPISTIDLGEQLANEIAQGSDIVGVGAQRLTDQAVAEANGMMLALIGETAPKYVAAPALPVTKSNLLESYRTVFDADPPAEIVEACEQNEGCE